MSCTETHDMGFSYRELTIPVKGENEPNEIAGDKQLPNIQGTAGPEEWEVRRKGADGRHTPVHSPAAHADRHTRGETVLKQRQHLDIAGSQVAAPPANTDGTPSSAPLPSASQAALSSFRQFQCLQRFCGWLKGIPKDGLNICKYHL